MTIVDTPERRQLRELTRSFVTREVLPHLSDWERAGEVPGRCTRPQPRSACSASASRRRSAAAAVTCSTR
ncbi:acyl-CoA dehydrogenase family protein [Micromonospora sp. BRA006-A]|nr:acyl-CoA dehydrogenase family protein [Micromonospora sp. BRA006-A]